MAAARAKLDAVECRLVLALFLTYWANLLQFRRLQIAQQLFEAEMLAREILNFKVKVTQSAHETLAPTEIMTTMTCVVSVQTWPCGRTFVDPR